MTSPFLALPAELRLRIYHLCIPQALCLEFPTNLTAQNRVAKWAMSPWGADPDGDTAGQVYCLSEKPSCPRCRDRRKAVGAILGSDNFVTDGFWSDDEAESEADDDPEYCTACHRYHPGIPPSRQSALPGLLLACRQVAWEFEESLFMHSTFIVKADPDGEARLAAFDRRHKMRRLILVLRPEGQCYRLGSRMDPQLWDPLLGGLLTLGIIAAQPPPAPRRDELPGSERGDWENWMMPNLRYLSKAVPGLVPITVDANDEEHTTQLIESVMPGRCRFQRLRVPPPPRIFRCL